MGQLLRPTLLSEDDTGETIKTTVMLCTAACLSPLPQRVFFESLAPAFVKDFTLGAHIDSVRSRGRPFAVGLETVVVKEDESEGLWCSVYEFDVVSMGIEVIQRGPDVVEGMRGGIEPA
jgi:hypothetical protein